MIPDKVIHLTNRSRNKRLKIETDLGMVYLVAGLTNFMSQQVESISVIADEGVYIALCYEDPETGKVTEVSLDSLRLRFIKGEK